MLTEGAPRHRAERISLMPRDALRDWRAALRDGT
jgi:hypothetical protein